MPFGARASRGPGGQGCPVVSGSTHVAFAISRLDYISQRQRLRHIACIRVEKFGVTGTLCASAIRQRLEPSLRRSDRRPVCKPGV